MEKNNRELAIEWRDKIPTLNFPSEWNVQIIPPFGGAIVRFVVKSNDKEISVYLDGYDILGYRGQPYWEAYPIEENSNHYQRFLINETKELIECIKKEINK